MAKFAQLYNAFTMELEVSYPSSLCLSFHTAKSINVIAITTILSTVHRFISIWK